METPTFEKWYSSKKKTAIAEINVKHAEVLASCDFSEILRNADEMVLFFSFFSFSLSFFESSLKNRM